MNTLWKSQENLTTLFVNQYVPFLDYILYIKTSGNPNSEKVLRKMVLFCAKMSSEFVNLVTKLLWKRTLWLSQPTFSSLWILYWRYIQIEREEKEPYVLMLKYIGSQRVKKLLNICFESKKKRNSLGMITPYDIELLSTYI